MILSLLLGRKQIVITAGVYLYTEASGIKKGQKAVLLSPAIRVRNREGQCLRFWYDNITLVRYREHRLVYACTKIQIFLRSRLNRRHCISDIMPLHTWILSPYSTATSHSPNKFLATPGTKVIRLKSAPS